ncbi:MAG: hypothetical protein ACI9FJ_000169 [Alteromonadaceae bacterium]|jgi:hypothetical protein
MNVAYINSPDLSFFSNAKEQLGQMITQLESPHYSKCEQGEIEQYITKEGDEILRPEILI